MSEWYWPVIALKVVFVFISFASYLRAEENVQKLPFCNYNINDDSGINDLLIVSTLDGKVTAFTTNDGTKLWNLETQPLLSSNLHHVELTAAGKWVRLVPSLRGTLYSLSGDTVEPLPFDAEQLLSSSFKYSDDLVIAGSRENQWRGVDAHTGAVVYECGTAGCGGEQTAAAGRAMLVLRRHANTVRALDPRTGHEKWNFSVAEIHLALSRQECAGGAPSEGPAGPLSVAVALPEGVVAVSTPDSHMLWRHQLDAPVAGMWRLRGGSLQSIDVVWEASQALARSGTPPPSLYIGLHDTQLYIQEGILYAQKLETAVSANPLPWKVKQARPQLDGGTALSLQDSDPNTLSLITLYGNTGQTGNHGFFLYLQETCEQSVQVPDDRFGPDVVLPNVSDDVDHHHVHVHVYSLWFWWKEVLLIAISSALLMNLMIWPRFFAPKTQPANQEASKRNNFTVVHVKHFEQPPSSPPAEYCGRYEADFTPLRCLGRGGFGVVFEARNNIDHCSYAVKRITLPKKESKRERVLREVRALAKLEHENIVRYFNAWVEEPPPMWQQERDKKWMTELEGVSVPMTDELTETSPPPFKSRRKEVTLDMNQCLEDELDNKLGKPPKRLRSLSCNDSMSIVFDEDATNPKLTSTSDRTPSKHTISSSKHSTNTSKPSTNSSKPSMNSSKPSVHSVQGSKKLGVLSKPSDDSFIVFANSGDQNSGSGLSEARKNSSFDKRLEKVKACEVILDSSHSNKKKKGHTRHWSLDMCVREAPPASRPDMYLYIQMQLCLRDNLHDWLRQRSADSRREAKQVFSQIVSAVEYVHLAGLIHRDLKPSNIFFAMDGRVKVGDFGLVTAMSDSSQDGSPTDLDVHARHTYRVGTHLYMSPEQLLGRPYSYKVDIYSLGVILFELLHPFGTESERVASLTRLRNHQYPHHFDRQHPDELKVLKLMLSEDPNQRPTATGVKARAPLFEKTEEKWHFTLPNYSVA